MKKEILLTRYIRELFSGIRGDWSDPRSECRAGWEACDRLTILLGGNVGEPYKQVKDETDEAYYKRIEEYLGSERGE